MVRFCSIGTSFITDWLMRAAPMTPDFQLKGVYSRSMEKARAFGEKYGVELYFDDLDQVGASEEIDAVYIASPNSLHCSQALKMIGYGKHVFIEKPIAANLRETKEILAAAKEKGVVAAEALRHTFNPGFDVLRECMGRLGKIRQTKITFAQYSSRIGSYLQGQQHNVFDHAMAGGALLDLGVYVVSFMTALYGAPKDIAARATFIGGENGAKRSDGAGMILADYGDMTVCADYSKLNNGANRVEIAGEKGWLNAVDTPNIYEITIHLNNGETNHITLPHEAADMRFELRHFLDMVAGKESPAWNQQISLDTMAVLDEARRQNGIVFPADK